MKTISESTHQRSGSHGEPLTQHEIQYAERLKAIENFVNYLQDGVLMGNIDFDSISHIGTSAIQGALKAYLNMQKDRKKKADDFFFLIKVSQMMDWLDQQIAMYDDLIAECEANIEQLNHDIDKLDLQIGHASEILISLKSVHDPVVQKKAYEEARAYLEERGFDAEKLDDEILVKTVENERQKDVDARDQNASELEREADKLAEYKKKKEMCEQRKEELAQIFGHDRLIDVVQKIEVTEKFVEENDVALSALEQKSKELKERDEILATQIHDVYADKKIEAQKQKITTHDTAFSMDDFSPI